MAKFKNVIGVRLSDEDVQKLDALATLTFRGRGDVLRCLIHQADALGSPDLILGQCYPSESPRAT